MEHKPAFSYQQIVEYMGKMRRKSQIDHPGATVQFITRAASERQRQGPPHLKEGNVGVIQWDCEGHGSKILHNFVLAYNEVLEKTFWMPTGDNATLTYSEFKYLGFEPC
jgi:hypothetical protein